MTRPEKADGGAEQRRRDDYHEIIGVAAASLAEDEYWVIEHPDGPLPQTASKIVTVPVLIVCNALDADWDDLCEAGFRLGRGHFDAAETADAMLAARSLTEGGREP